MREGCTIYDLEFTGGGNGRVLRLYIDKADGQNVSIEDCANVSRGLNLMLDVDDVIPGGRYDLEVSSPGVERVLREEWHFEKSIGKTISLKSFAPLIDFNPERADLAKARTLQGELKSVETAGIRVAAGESDVFIPFESITKAQVVFEFGPQNGKAQNKGGKKPKGKSRR
ncbi:MAG: ribosome maturation factor RimP [Bdellovibrionaceae bacterium]|nr:ribosome maturation factor RimP [Pseudobdellovibrionaceae bacterium]